MILKNLVAANGAYTDRNGQEKKRWVKVGDLHEHDGRQYITLEATVNLAGLERKEGETRIFCNLFDPEPRGGQPSRPTPRAAAPAPDDDIPF